MSIYSKIKYQVSFVSQKIYNTFAGIIFHASSYVNVKGEILIKIFSKPLLYPLCSGEYRRSQLLFILEAVVVNAAVILTTGVFLSGYMVYLKASDMLVGLLNNAQVWASIIALFSYLFYERMEKRKNLLILLNLASRLLICSTVFLPLFIKSQNILLFCAASMVILGNILWCIYGVGLNTWLMSIVPRETRNDYIYIRMFCLRISFTLVTIVMGFVLDLFQKSHTGFLVVYVTSLIFSLMDILILVNIKEPPNQVKIGGGFDPATFLEPLHHTEYRKFLVFVFFFHLSLTLSSSFTSLYLIRYLQFDYTFISAINVLSYALLILCIQFWSRIESKKGLRYVLSVSSLFVVLEFFIYSFLQTSTFYLLFLAAVISGFGHSGFNIALFTYRYEIMPESNKTIYEGWFGATWGISLLLAPVIGSFLMNKLPVIHNAVYQFSSFQLLYLLSFILASIVVFFSFFKPTGNRQKCEAQDANSGAGPGVNR